MKQNIKHINEDQLKAIITESIKNILNEMELPDYSPIIKGKTPNGCDDEFAGINNSRGKDLLNDINELCTKVSYLKNYSTNEQDAEIDIMYKCLKRAYEACLNYCKLPDVE